MQKDNFRYGTPGRESPASDAVAVSPGPDLLPFVTRALYVGGGGDLSVTMLSGANVTFRDVPSGSILPIRVTHVLGTGTSADFIVALA